MTQAASNGSEEGGILYRLRYLIALIALSVLQYGIVAPSIQFVILTFFAQRHGGGDCELTPSSKPCRQAAADFAVYRGISIGIAAIFQWGAALLLGSYSDTKGRRSFFVAKSLLSVLPITALVAHILLETTLWVYLVIAPLYDVFDTNGVFLGFMSDVITEPKLRTAAYAQLACAFLMLIGVVLMIGGMMSATNACYVALIACAIKVVFVLIVFPETVKKANLEAPLPGIREVFSGAKELLLRNSFIMKMAIILIFSGLSAAGLGTLSPSYFTAYMGVKKLEGTQLMVTAGVSVALALVFLLPCLGDSLGEVGTMRVSLIASVLFPAWLILCTKLWEVFVLIFVLAGLMFLSFPTISGIKSNLVNDDEQGLLQGALAAMRVLAEAAAYFFFGWLYFYSTDGGKAPRSSTFIPFCLCAGLAAVATIIAFQLPGQLPQPSKTGGDSNSQPLAERNCFGTSGQTSYSSV